MKNIIEPFRIKIVEAIFMNDEAKRPELLKSAMRNSRSGAAIRKLEIIGEVA